MRCNSFGIIMSLTPKEQTLLRALAKLVDVNSNSRPFEILKGLAASFGRTVDESTGHLIGEEAKQFSVQLPLGNGLFSIKISSAVTVFIEYICCEARSRWLESQVAEKSAQALRSLVLESCKNLSMSASTSSSSQ